MLSSTVFLLDDVVGLDTPVDLQLIKKTHTQTHRKSGDCYTMKGTEKRKWTKGVKGVKIVRRVKGRQEINAAKCLTPSVVLKKRLDRDNFNFL